MKIGIMDGVVRGTNPGDAFVKAKQLGVDGIEVNLKRDQLHAEPAAVEAELKAASDAASLPICSFVLGEHNHGGLACSWLADQATDDIRAAVALCAVMHVKTLLVPFFFWNEPKGHAHRAVVIERLKPLCAESAAGGVTIAFEGVLPPEPLAELVDRSGDGCGVYFDPANLVWCDLDPARSVEILGKRIVAAHAKDADTFSGDARLGAGRVDHATVADAMHRVGFDGWMTLETMGGEETANEIDFVRRVYARGRA
jgi:sugar phosphate isomerase/epimerase